MASGNVIFGWYWKVLDGIKWYWMVLDGIGWHWIVLDGTELLYVV